MLGIVKNGTFNVKLMWILFWQLLKKIGLLFTPTSGHTGHSLNTQVRGVKGSNPVSNVRGHVIESSHRQIFATLIYFNSGISIDTVNGPIL